MIDIDVALVTWPNHPKRFEYFQTTVDSLRKGLAATGCTLHYLCASESERDPKCRWMGEELEAFCQSQDIPLSYRQGAAGLGRGMNHALRCCTHDYILLVQDDWLLLDSLDLRPGVDLMESTVEVDLVRYSWRGMDRVHAVDQPDGWRRLDVDGGWPYGDDPALRRRSFMDKHGWYVEHGRHGTSEGAMVHRLRKNRANIRIADKIYFGHLGQVVSVIDDKRPQIIPRNEA